MIKSMAAPYTNVKFMPTGGIGTNNMKSYLDFDKIIAIGGSWMVKTDMISAGQFDKIRDLTREAVQTMLGFEVRHVGINCNTEDEANQVADRFDNVFGFTKKDGNSSIFAGTGVEVMKSPFLGAHGHIAIGTNYADRALNYLEMQGFKFDMSTAKYKNGKLIAVYMAEEIGGFAVHLLQK